MIGPQLGGRSMHKTIIILAFAFGITTFHQTAWAEQVRKVYRIGFLGHVPHTKVLEGRMAAFREGLSALGYFEDRKVRILYRYPERRQGRLSRLAVLAAGLVRDGVDVIVVPAQPATDAARKATSTIPIVAMIGADRVVSNLSHPEANITGLSSMSFKVLGKQLQLFKEAVPTLSNIAVLWNPGHRHHPSNMRLLEKASKAIGLRIVPVDVRGPNTLGDSFHRVASAGVDGVMVFRGGMLASLRPRISDKANEMGLPTMFGLPADARAGGLMAYGTGVPALYRRAASYVVKILEGAKPRDLPVQRPTKFELVINLKTAKALGIKIPSSILLQADETIQ